MSREEAEAGIDQAIRDVALEEKSQTFSANLSGGMKRKLSVAIAFCKCPKKLLCGTSSKHADKQQLYI